MSKSEKRKPLVSIVKWIFGIMTAFVLLIIYTNYSMNKDHKEHLTLWGSFEYRKDKADEWCKVSKDFSIPNRFFGDCEDYAFSLQDRIGGEVWHIILYKDKNDKFLDKPQRHAVLVKDNLVYDNMFMHPKPLSFYFETGYAKKAFKMNQSAKKVHQCEVTF